MSAAELARAFDREKIVEADGITYTRLRHGKGGPTFWYTFTTSDGRKGKILDRYSGNGINSKASFIWEKVE